MNKHTTSDSQAQGKFTVYLLHFDRKLEHSQHYCGCTMNLDKRLTLHMMGQSNARIMSALHRAKINFRVARTWQVETPELEGILKRSHNLARVCPICRSQAIMRKLASQLLPTPLDALFATESSLQAILPM